MSTLLKARGDTAGETPLAASLLKALVGKLKAAKELNVHGLTEFMQACSSSALPQILIDQLLGEVENVAMAMASPDSFGLGPASKIQQVPQELMNVPSYLSVKDWEKLEAMDMENGIQVLVSRLRRLGVRSLKETTKKACTATLVLVEMAKGKGMPPYNNIYRLSQVFQQAFIASDIVPEDGVQSLCKYPSNAADLWPQVLKKVYTADDPRLPRHLSNLPYMMANHIPVRNTSSLLNPTAGGSSVTKTSHTKGNIGVDAMGSIGEIFLQRLGEQFSQSLAALVGHGPAQTGGTKVQFLGRKKTQSFLEDTTNANDVLALPVHEPSQVPEPKLAAPDPKMETLVEPPVPKPAPKESEEAQTEVQPGDKLQGKGLADLEQKMFDSLREKKTKGGGKGMKRPAAAKPAKKVAAPPPKAKEVKKETKKGKTLKTFGCPRCRGNKNGCATCWDPLYKGVRLPGREPWKQYMASKGKAVK